MLLEAAAYSSDVYTDVRRVIHRQEPISSSKLYYDELVQRAKDDEQTDLKGDSLARKYIHESSIKLYRYND